MKSNVAIPPLKMEYIQEMFLFNVLCIIMLYWRIKQSVAKNTK